MAFNKDGENFLEVELLPIYLQPILLQIQNFIYE